MLKQAREGARITQEDLAKKFAYKKIRHFQD
jgi:hypothetical protein